MATDPVTVPRPRKVPESLMKTRVQCWTVCVDVEGNAGAHLTARVEMTSAPQGAVSMGRKVLPSHLVM